MSKQQATLSKQRSTLSKKHSTFVATNGNSVEQFYCKISFFWNDNVECCFDIVAVFGNNVAGFGNNVERNFVISTKSKQIEHVQFVSNFRHQKTKACLVAMTSGLDT